jgi:perosamine synthetase
MWSRKRFDIGWLDMLYGARRLCFPPDREDAARRVEALWPNPENSLVCLSVRTGFDLWLGALDLPKGSEVLVSAVTIPDMAKIVKQHGLVPVPVDLDLERMTPTLDAWRRAITPATRLVLTAHLFGGHTQMEPLLELARQHNLLVAEDCAQAYAGLDYPGHAQAAVSMFSFGTIKNSTAFGGAVLQVRDRELLARMRAAQAQYPVQARWAYCKRLAKYGGLKLFSYRPLCGAIINVFRMFGSDYDGWVNRAARGFPGDAFFHQIRRQPCAPVLALLERRLRRFDAQRARRHSEKGRALTAALQLGLDSPGTTVSPNTYWVYPVLVDEPHRFLEHLARAGFDATQGQSLCAVAPPDGRADQAAVVARNMLRKLVFLPFYPEIPPREAQRMAKVVRNFFAKS